MSEITRRFQADNAVREAVYSACETYRYSLTVTWDDAGRRLLYIMLNPSKATEISNDPTIERCERRARALGYGAFRVVNLFALRETSPERLKKAKKPEGYANTKHLVNAVEWCDEVLASWGVHGAHRNQAAKVENLLRSKEIPLLCLGITKDGHPRHPLYISYAVTPEPWRAAR